MFVCKANKCHCLCFIFSLGIFNLHLAAQKSWKFESISRGENTFNWLFHLNQPTKWSGRPSWRCNLFTSPMGPMYSINLHLYNIATNGWKMIWNPKLYEVIFFKKTARVCGSLKTPASLGKKMWNTVWFAATEHPKRSFRTSLALQKLVVFSGSKDNISWRPRSLSTNTVCLNTVTVDRVVRAHRVPFIQNEEIIAPVTRFRHAPMHIYLARALLGHF